MPLGTHPELSPFPYSYRNGREFRTTPSLCSQPVSGLAEEEAVLHFTCHLLARPAAAAGTATIAAVAGMSEVKETPQLSRTSWNGSATPTLKIVLYGSVLESTENTCLLRFQRRKA